MSLLLLFLGVCEPERQPPRRKNAPGEGPALESELATGKVVAVHHHERTVESDDWHIEIQPPQKGTSTIQFGVGSLV